MSKAITYNSNCSSVTALGKEGGDYTISILKRQLQQVMEQICSEDTADFPKFLKKQ